MNKMGKLALSVVMAGSVLFAGGNASEAANNKSSDDVLIINKATHKLAFYQDGKKIGTYSVATGKDNKSNKTPEGKFPIVNKVKNRPYYAKNIPGGDPKNPLGPRWMGFAVKGSWGSESGNVFGIHGNNNPKSIGTNASGGCVRMDNEVIKALYDKVLNGTMVKIYNRSSTTLDKVALDMGYIKAKDAEIMTKAKIVKWKGDIVRIEYGKNKVRKNLITSNKWYQKNLKKGKTYNFYYKGSKITKVNS